MVKGRPYHPELTGLLGTSSKCMWSGGQSRPAVRTEHSGSG